MDIKIFADGADKKTILELANNPLIRGLTTNPTLMRKAGIKDYKAFCKDLLPAVSHLPISFEVFEDSPLLIYHQALEIASWGSNVYVKIPVTNTQRREMYPIINQLSREGVKVNVTAIMTLDQVLDSAEALSHSTPSYISVFAGRIADTGRDPIPRMAKALKIIRDISPQTELIWASPREVLNIVQADEIGCDIITATKDILDKLPLLGKNLDDYSLDTVKMFYKDAQESGYKL
jgi:transaldolase